MKTSDEFVDEFLKGIKAGTYKKEHLTNKGPVLTKEFVEKEVADFEEFLTLEVINDVLKGSIGI